MAQTLSRRCSSIGMKHLMAITGLLWCGFAFSHMAGNLLLFVGPDSYNSYGHKLTSNPLILVAELVLVVTLLAHMYSALRVTLINRAARPQRYAVSPQVKGKASLAARSMALTGALILVFIVLHLFTFKFGEHYTTTVGGEQIRDLYTLVKEVFSQPVYVGWYVLSMVVLFFHLQHALYSSLQTLGWVPYAYEKQVIGASYAFGAIVAFGFIVAPILFFLKGGNI